MNFTKIMENYNAAEKKWEVRIVEDNNERLLTRCNEKRDCYKEITKLLITQGIKKEHIRYHEHPYDNYLVISSTGDFHFRLYNI